ncbi:DUF4286 family protein [Rhizorhabdus argentea]|uniref:DUF4286 family protein n=1 Tax=Rhizorhabdus argentea TaxID=1387174 RepID=UPI0030ECB66B
MTSFKFIALSNPVEGQEQDYNDWYSNRHIQDVVQTPGFVSAQRFKIVPTPKDNCPYRYLAIYEIESANVEEAIKALFERGLTGAMPISPALDTTDLLSGVFEAIEGATAS